MSIKNKPWVEDSDPLKPYYGKLTNKEYINISKIFNLWINNHNYIDPSIIAENKKVNLLDYYNRYDEECGQSLYKMLCEVLKYTDGYLYWLPIDNAENHSTFEEYFPAMIAKTPIDIRYLDYTSRSFLQIQNGGYAIIESNLNFIALILDGNYMQVALDTKLMNGRFQKYLDNWHQIRKNLDEITAKCLSKAYFIQ
ncbi:hypothetical protein F991_00140 [Acinetobacter sp. CIP-A165]|uniref:hypothetical protein n=1 Tax=Acinetobacter sp. CIP-A165 TaxID=40373 RepID=UPI0002D10028|nr:hypothetical protein [Acinetobacter sp. CIP-A165]ENU32027.1 hypothetical protein F991_00140 [Acinetobacter sp. CIP-A165]